MRKFFCSLFILFISVPSLIRADLTDSIDQYSLSINHPLYSTIDTIFSNPTVLDTQNDLVSAGFEIIQIRNPQIVIAAHPHLPGHLIKVYLHSSSKPIESRWKNFVNRCSAAQGLHKLIQTENLRYFTVPNKWIYTTKNQDPVLLVTRMNIVSSKQTKQAWKNVVGPEHLKEFLCILSHGYGSCKLAGNTPYTNEGKFACVDLERPPSQDFHIDGYLSQEMQQYWNQLVKEFKNGKRSP